MSCWIVRNNMDGFVQDYSIAIANALDILQSCTEPSIYWLSLFEQKWCLLQSQWWRRSSLDRLRDRLLNMDMFSSFLTCYGENPRSPVYSLHKERVMRSFEMFLMLVWTSSYTNSQVAGDLGTAMTLVSCHCDVGWYLCTFLHVICWLKAYAP